ncbi:addiction module protein [Rhodoferax sp.]|uniref:addiction module protein n=1 Tax=Rhodoferax sp. TaxID=50421 RepID=UPI00277A59AD|nr:addiction module protein [Rhodoferax sp.]
MQTAELIALPLADRLQAMEALWDSLRRDQTFANTVPAWHEEELSKRLDDLDAGQATTIQWDEARQRIRQHAEQLVRPAA